MAVFSVPVVLLKSAPKPVAVLSSPLVLKVSAPEPAAVFSVPAVLLKSAKEPMAVLSLAVLLLKSAPKPVAVLFVPVVLLRSAWKPSAVLDEPVVLLESENQPCAVLSDPVVAKLSASTFSAALLPLPRSSEARLACATGETAKQASMSRIAVNTVFRFFIKLVSFLCWLSFYKGIPDRALQGILVFFERFALPPNDCRRPNKRSRYVGIEQIRKIDRNRGRSRD